VAENLLLRGGYRRTHFQADQTTLQAVSQMGTLWKQKIEALELRNQETFIPKFTKLKQKVSIPEIFQFQELILQAIIRKYFYIEENLKDFLSKLNIKDISPDIFEVLGEKAFPEGHVDILIKESTPVGISRKIIIEVKTGVANEQDLNQLRNYVNEIGEECIAAVLIAKKFQRVVIREAPGKRINLFEYNFANLNDISPFTFDDLFRDFYLSKF